MSKASYFKKLKEDRARIARERVATLTVLSVDALREGRLDRAVRYVDLSLRICRRTQTRMPRDFAYCRKCLVPLIPGFNERIRLGGERITSTCHNCGNIKRKPYTRGRNT